MPAVDTDGNLSWSNDGGLDNPAPANITGPEGKQGKTGTAFIPDVDVDGNLSWSNDAGLDNPTPVNITGPPGPQGEKGADGKMSFEDLTEAQKEGLKGATFTPAVTESGDLSWTNNGGYENPATVNLKGEPGNDGPQGEGGLSVVLERDSIVIPCDASGGITDMPQIMSIPFYGLKGTTQVACTCEAGDAPFGMPNPPVTQPSTPTKAGTILLGFFPSATMDGAKQGTIDLTFTIEGTKLYRKLGWVKAIAGQQGIKGDKGNTPEIGENSNWFIGGTDTGKPSRGDGADLTQAARAYYEEIVVPIDGTEVESKHINPTGMIVPNNSVVFLVGRFIIDGTTYNFSTTTLLIYAKTTLYNLSATPASDSIKRTVQITIKSDGPLTYKLTAGTNSKLGDTTVQMRMIVLNVAYMQGTYKYDKVLANNSWAQIAEASKNGCANMLWNIGDEIDIELTGAYAQTLTLQIADFYYDALADGTGKAGITFVCKHLTKDKKRLHNSSTTPKWNVSEMHTTTLPSIMKCMSSELQNAIKLVSKETAGDNSFAEPTKSTDYLFLLSKAETRASSPSEYGEGIKYKIFDDTANRIKKMSNGSGEAASYYLRPSPTSNSADIMMYNGESGATFDASVEYGVCFGFCV